MNTLNLDRERGQCSAYKVTLLLRRKEIVALLLLMILSVIRNLSPQGGVPTQLEDYATHINIEENIKQGNLFPEIHLQTGGANSVSKYLPIYHGLVGFHLSSIFLEILGFPLPGAYGFLMDVSLLLSCLFLIFLLRQIHWREKWFETVLGTFLFLTIGFYQFSRGVDDAFFSQIWAYSLFLLAFYSYWKKLWINSALLLLASAITYPDILLWVLPVLAFVKVPKYQILYRCFLLGVWLILMAVLYTRLQYLGFVSYSLFPFTFLILAFALYAKDIFRSQRQIFFLALTFILVCSFFLLAGARFFHFSYYSIKLTYPAIFWLVYFILRYVKVWTFRGSLLCGLLIFYFPTMSDFNIEPIKKYFSYSPNITNALYKSMRQTQDNVKLLAQENFCKPENTLVLPSEKDYLAEKATLIFWARNALFLNYEIYSYSFINEEFNQIFNSAAPGGMLLIAGQFRDDWQKGYQFVAQQIARSEVKDKLCLIVEASKAHYFHSDRYELIKNQDGLTYLLIKGLKPTS